VCASVKRIKLSHSMTLRGRRRFRCKVVHSLQGVWVRALQRIDLLQRFSLFCNDIIGLSGIGAAI
jgi:hypothetical protein